jgi:aspartyl-tRNA(Asn)/glutamyl-tRNA(Gln) amidotransferase subunit A
MTDLTELDITDASELIRSLAISPRELLDAFLARIETFDPKIGAFITVTADRARKAAAEAEREIARGHWRGRLHGIPYGLKDIISTAGIRTTGNSRVSADNIPSANAFVVDRIEAAGGVLLGKLATWEFAHGIPDADSEWPAPRNPWDLSRATGGSSSGSAAAVAAAMLPCALGTDTGGSIRIPAALTGIAGLKPTFGLVSRAGIISNSHSFDYCGPMTWTVRDCALLLKTIVGHDPADATTVDGPIVDYASGLDGRLDGLRIGIPDWTEKPIMSEAARHALDKAIEVLRGLGAEVVGVHMPPAQRFYDVKTVIGEAEIFSVHEAKLRSDLTAFGSDFLNRTLAGCLFSAVDYVRAQRERKRLIDEMEQVYRACDILLTGSGGPAPLYDSPTSLDYRGKWSQPSFQTPFSVTGGPALSVCSGFTDDGLPLAIQLAGRPFEDALVLKVGAAFEEATSLRKRRPAISYLTSPTEVTAMRSDGAEPVDDEMVRTVGGLLRRAGINASESIVCDLAGVAPYAFAMAERIKAQDWNSPPASVFRLKQA